MVDCESRETATTEEWLKEAVDLVAVAVTEAESVTCFVGRWRSVIKKLEQLPRTLSDLSTHPCFTKNPICKEQIQAVVSTLQATLDLAKACASQTCNNGKLHMQSNLDALSAKLDLNLRDCDLLVRSGVLGEVTDSHALLPRREGTGNVRELLARLQIGHMEAKHKVLEALMERDEKEITEAAGRNSISALVQLLGASSPRIREKAAAIVCTIAKAGPTALMGEGTVPALVRLLESGSPMAKEMAAMSLSYLTLQSENARAVAGHAGITVLLELCQSGTAGVSTAAMRVIRNMVSVPEVRHSLAEEGALALFVSLLDTDSDAEAAMKDHAAHCLQHMTCGNETLRRSVVAQGGVQRLLCYIDNCTEGAEPAVGALRNLSGSVAAECLIGAGVLPRLLKVVTSGSVAAQEMAVGVICRMCSSSNEARRAVGERGFIGHLVRMLESKSGSGVQEGAAQALSVLTSYPPNCRELRKVDDAIPSLVAILDPVSHNTAKKYAISVLSSLSSNRKCRKLMVSYGARVYLKKLTEMDVFGARKLLEKLQRGRLTALILGKR